MIKLILVIGVTAAALWGLVVSIENYLTVDDLANCPEPDVTSSACAPADAIVAISGGDTAARANEAIKLYLAGWAPRLIFSGAALDRTGPSNAEVMRLQAQNAGVPHSAITIDNNAVDTAGNARNTSALLQHTRRVILVTSPYHQRRAWLEFERFFGKTVTIINHPTNTDRLWPGYWWTTLNGWILAGSETVKTLIVAAR